MAGDRLDPPQPIVQSAYDRLDSWKEIASYLRKEIRTVQRWEKTLGLPVRRLAHGKLAAVFAYKHELDAWWHESQSKLEVEEDKAKGELDSSELDLVVEEGALDLVEEDKPKGENQPDEPRLPNRVRLYAVVITLSILGLALLLIAWQPQITQSFLGTKPRIILAVRPFRNLSSDPGQDFIAEGLTEEMITRLGQLHPEHMGVIRLSAVYGSNPSSLNGTGLRADYILEGGVRHVGQKVAITAQLIQARDQTQVWGESYDRDLQDLLRIQSEVAGAIAREVLTKLPHHQTAMRQVNPEAYLAYLEGRYFWGKRTEAGFAKAITLFQRSIQIDPTYAPPYAGLADCYQLLGSAPYSTLTPSEAFPKAEEAARKALQLDDTLAEAHVPLGISELVYERNFPEARKEFERALELRPEYATGHQFFGYYLTAMGQTEEAIGERKKALELDPLSPLLHSALGEAYYHARRFDLSIAQNTEALELDPTYAIALVNIGRAYNRLNMHQQAREAFQRILAAAPEDPAILSLLGHEYAVSGDAAKAMKTLAKLQEISAKKYVPAVYFAVIYTGLNRKDDAFHWLDKAYEERCEYLVYLRSEPLADPLRSDPRFPRLLARLGLEPANLSPATQTP
jgi:TolB-like protein/Flp pilus assembly protein TadD